MDVKTRSDHVYCIRSICTYKTPVYVYAAHSLKESEETTDMKCIGPCIILITEE